MKTKFIVTDDRNLKEFNSEKEALDIFQQRKKTLIEYSEEFKDIQIESETYHLRLEKWVGEGFEIIEDITVDVKKSQMTDLWYEDEM